MRVLDIDLDFFLAGCCPLADKGRRPELFGHEPWESGRVRRFLEGNCGLSKDRPIPGRIFETHDSALELWRDMLEAKRLTAPFDVTHIDAHSDLGIGYPGPGYVLNGVLPIRYDKRADAEKYRRLNGLDEANYLLFALAFRWISSLENVRNPSSLPDIPKEILVPGKAASIQLSSFTAALSLGINGKEPVIPFNVYEDYNGFKAEEKYDFMSVAISPRYSPKEADVLLPVFEEYMTLV